MPNWCVNHVDIEGDEAKVAELIALVKDGDSEFSFHKIVPPPLENEFYQITDKQNHFQCGCREEFVETSPEVQGEGEHKWSADHGYKPREGYWAVDGKKVEKVVNPDEGVHASISNALGGMSVCPIHQKPKFSDHPDWWYNWNLNNWGSKWGASDIWNDRVDNGEVHEGSTRYYFETAWSPAEPVIAALAEQFPTLNIEHRYCEGGNGYAGEVIYKDGAEVSRKEYEQGQYPDGAFYGEDDPDHDSWERNYDKVPMSDFEKFCDEYFGGVVGG